MSRLAAGWLLFCALMVSQSGVPNTHQSTKTRNEIDDAFSSKKTVVLIVAPSKSAGEDESEAYGDWADSLNGFTSSLPADTKIVKLTAAQYKQQVEEPQIRRVYATVFLRDAAHALLYDGMIVEAKAYNVGLEWLHEHPDEKAMAAYGLHEKSAKLK